MLISGGKCWFTALELAELALPGLPATKRKVNERAEDERWALKVGDDGLPLARPRQGRGGGLEYHHSVLPDAAKGELVRRGIVFASVETNTDVAGDAARLWAWYDGQTDTVRAEAERRAAIVGRVDAFKGSGMTASAAVAEVAKMDAISSSTLWNWLRLVDGVEPADRLPHLAPRRQGGGRESDVDARLWQFLLSDYLRPEKPTFSSCYYRLVHEYAPLIGTFVPHERTLRRKLDREVDQRLIVARREGADALRQMMPAQKRTVAHLHAMEMVNIDGHKFDVFVRFPDGKVRRPIMVALQDIFSHKIVAWRIGESENAVNTRLVFADLFRDYGIPKSCLLDNGRAFASKWITGGAKTRFRFKIKDIEPTGLLTSLGIAIHWATPYRGQSKPIERAFRDLCDTISRRPEFAGAYTGPNTQAKPENYGDRAVPLADFMTVVTKGIAIHNARGKRNTETARGRSFDDAFAESYASAPIGKASPEQLRLALLMGEQLLCDRKTGSITIHGNRYWSAELSQIAGKRVTVRFDPDDLSLDIHVYDQAGRYLCSAPVLEMSGFDDVAAAKARARQEAEWRKATKRAGEIEELLAADQIAAMLPAYTDESELPEPQVIRPVRHRGQTAAALKPVPHATPSNDQFMDQFSAGMTALRLVE